MTSLRSQWQTHHPEFPSHSASPSIKIPSSSEFPFAIISVDQFMENPILYVLILLNFAFGMAGLVWPEKFLPLFGILLFPWPATRRMIRVNGSLAVVAYVLILFKIWIGGV
jgi:hypothetical protein